MPTDPFAAFPDVDESAAPSFSAPKKVKKTPYDTALTPDEEVSFAAWKAKNAPNDSGEDYDLRGAFKEGLSPDPVTFHWPDTYKKPNHPTFSNQSKYAVGEDAKKAGTWNGEEFIPAPKPKSFDDYPDVDESNIGSLKEPEPFDAFPDAPPLTKDGKPKFLKSDSGAVILTPEGFDEHEKEKPGFWESLVNAIPQAAADTANIAFDVDRNPETKEWTYGQKPSLIKRAGGIVPAGASLAEGALINVGDIADAGKGLASLVKRPFQSTEETTKDKYSLYKDMAERDFKRADLGQSRVGDYYRLGARAWRGAGGNDLADLLEGAASYADSAIDEPGGQAMSIFAADPVMLLTPGGKIVAKTIGATAKRAVPAAAKVALKDLGSKVAESSVGKGLGAVGAALAKPVQTSLAAAAPVLETAGKATGGLKGLGDLALTTGAGSVIGAGAAAASGAGFPGIMAGAATGGVVGEGARRLGKISNLLNDAGQVARGFKSASLLGMSPEALRLAAKESQNPTVQRILLRAAGDTVEPNIGAAAGFVKNKGKAAKAAFDNLSEAAQAKAGKAIYKGAGVLDDIHQVALANAALNSLAMGGDMSAAGQGYGSGIVYGGMGGLTGPAFEQAARVKYNTMNESLDDIALAKAFSEMRDILPPDVTDSDILSSIKDADVDAARKSLEEDLAKVNKGEMDATPEIKALQNRVGFEIVDSPKRSAQKQAFVDNYVKSLPTEQQKIFAGAGLPLGVAFKIAEQANLGKGYAAADNKTNSNQFYLDQPTLAQFGFNVAGFQDKASNLLARIRNAKALGGVSPVLDEMEAQLVAKGARTISNPSGIQVADETADQTPTSLSNVNDPSFQTGHTAFHEGWHNSEDVITEDAKKEGDPDEMAQNNANLRNALIGVRDEQGRMVNQGAYTEEQLDSLVKQYVDRLKAGNPTFDPGFDHNLTAAEILATQGPSALWARNDLIASELRSEHGAVFGKGADDGLVNMANDVDRGKINYLKAALESLGIKFSANRPFGSDRSDVFGLESGLQGLNDSPLVNKAIAQVILAQNRINKRLVSDSEGRGNTREVKIEEINGNPDLAKQAVASGVFKTRPKTAPEIQKEAEAIAKVVTPNPTPAQVEVAKAKVPTETILTNSAGQPVMNKPAEVKRQEVQIATNVIDVLNTAPLENEEGAFYPIYKKNPDGSDDTSEIIGYGGRYLTDSQMAAINNAPDSVIPKRIKETLSFIYKYADKNKRDPVTGEKLEGTPLEWIYYAALKGKKYSSGIQQSTRTGAITSNRITKAGNFTTNILDVSAFLRALDDELKKNPEKFAAWGSAEPGATLPQVKDNFMADVAQYLDNHQNGRKGETGLDPQTDKAQGKAHVINEFFNIKDKEHPKSGEFPKNQFYRTLRIDRVGNVQETTGPKFPVRLKMQKEKFMPSRNASGQPPAFYSQLQRAIEEKMPNKASVAQIRGIVNGAQVKPDELKWSNLEGFLEGKQNVTKQEVLDYLANEGAVKFQEVVLDEDAPEKNSYWDPGEENQPENPHKYSQYVLPGGLNYREVVLTMPEKSASNDAFEQWKKDAEYSHNRVQSNPQSEYRSPHFDNIPNYVAHMRLNDREDSNGDPGLFMEELQSDRHQRARDKGYSGEQVEFPTDWTGTRDPYTGQWMLKDAQGNIQGNESGATLQDAVKAKFKREAIPDAPFRQSKEWGVQLFKRALRDAIAGNQSWIGWTDGATQADRFDLSKKVDKIVVTRETDGSYTLDATPLTATGGSGVDQTIAEVIPESKLADYIGKDLANKVIGDQILEGTVKRYSGGDLKVGGEGMKGFYDQILPKEIGKYVKKWGGKVEVGQIPTTNERSATGFQITPSDHGWEVSDANGTALTDETFDSRGDAQKWIDQQESGGTKIWQVKITPEMRQSIQSQGQPLFQPTGVESRLAEMDLAQAFNAAVESGNTQEAQALLNQMAGSLGLRVMPYQDEPVGRANIDEGANFMPPSVASKDKSFMDWFGGSVLVDENGLPKVFYKGMPAKDWRTGNLITDLKSPNGPWAGFFSSSPDVASKFARLISYKGEGNVVYPAYIKMENPYIVDATGKAAGELQFDIRDDSGPYSQKNNPEILNAIESGDYDGVILKNTVDEGDVVVPLKSSQIRNSIGR